MKVTEETKELLQELQIIPRMDSMIAICEDACLREGKDAAHAPIWAKELVHTYSKVLEVKYPEFRAANGEVRPISTIPPASLEWEYFTVDGVASVSWIDDDGQVLPSAGVTTKRHHGEVHEMGGGWDTTIFDLERAAMAKKGGAKVDLGSVKQKAIKRAHDAKTNWVWLFGDSAKGLPGLCNHPNITVSTAPTKAVGGSRAWDANATNEEIAADFSLLVNKIAEDTLESYHGAVVFLPPDYLRFLRDRLLGQGDGFASLLDLLRDRFSGDDSGQGKVEIKTLIECAAKSRKHPETQTDTSGIPGDFMICLPPASDEIEFIRSRPFTQLPPERHRFTMHNLTHSGIGGCKVQTPLAVHRVDFAVGA